MFELDHLVVSANLLQVAADRLAAVFGVSMAPGGQHAAFGTHNRLLSLGPDDYLEVIAIDPAAPPPERPRWYGLDDFDADLRLTNWALRTTELASALAVDVAAGGDVLEVSRGTLNWSMVVPPEGNTPQDGCVPALLSWTGEDHPCRHLPDHGVRLKTLTVTHPQTLDPRLAFDPRVRLAEGPTSLSAVFETPRGEVVL